MSTNRNPVIAVAEGAFAILDDLKEELAGQAQLVEGPVDSPEAVAKLTEGADALAVTLHPMRAEHIGALPDSVKVIVRAGVGLDTVDIAAAQARGVRVVYQPNYATNEVADHAATMALAAWRRIGQYDGAVRRDGWTNATQGGKVHALHQSTLGIVGAGRIGRAVIARLTPFVEKVVAFDAQPSGDGDGITWVGSPTEVFRQANLISLHVPLTEETRNIVDAAALASMPSGTVLVNVSRGGLIDEAALADALASGQIAGAAMDVFTEEPLPADSPLRAAPNLLLSPHVAWYSEESGSRLAHWSVEDAISFSTSGTIMHGSHAWR